MHYKTLALKTSVRQAWQKMAGKWHHIIRGSLVWLHVVSPGIEQLPEPVDGQQQGAAHQALLFPRQPHQCLCLHEVHVGHVHGAA